jgi:ATP-dependent DNA ligase
MHEIKYDGYRFQCHIQRSVRFYTRRGNDWTDRLDGVTGVGRASDRSL